MIWVASWTKTLWFRLWSVLGHLITILLTSVSEGKQTNQVRNWIWKKIMSNEKWKTQNVKLPRILHLVQYTMPFTCVQTTLTWNLPDGLRALCICSRSVVKKSNIIERRSNLWRHSETKHMRNMKRVHITGLVAGLVVTSKGASSIRARCIRILLIVSHREWLLALFWARLHTKGFAKMF